GTSKTSILITQIPLVPVTGLVVYRYFRPGHLPETAVKVTIPLVALAGLSFAIYLGVTWVATGDAPTCSAGGGCSAAETSDGATLFFGIRTTTVGMIGYSLILLSLLVPGNLGRISTAFLGTFGFGTSAYLTTYLATEFNTSCQWCLGSSVAMTTIFALAYWRLAQFFEASGSPDSSARSR
ncbi:MAG: vitamin K epoxide reductase family protein, partial [Solirubrobacterales bacterium]